MVFKIFPNNINDRYIKNCSELLKNNEVIICPTDTIYGFMANINSPKAIDNLCRLKGLDPAKANLSVMFYNLSQLSAFTTPINNTIFKALKRALPGPFTFILEANNEVPKFFKNRKKTIGIRIPDNPITLALLKTVNTPLVVSSVIDEDEIIEYPTDPDVIIERFEDKVAAIIDGGAGNNIASTIVDCSKGKIEIIREGLGDITLLY
jgi:tRNA threonylcarbamoyl adenosine modification protein (Sua5/YciO/YrdC/YwlC family)